MEALSKGEERLRRFLDLLSFGTKYSSATYYRGKEHLPFAFDRERTTVNVSETEWAFVRDTCGTNRFWIHQTPNQRRQSDVIIGKNDPILSLSEVFKCFVEKTDSLTDSERSILNALHTLRQVQQSIDGRDALDHIWRFMEFLLFSYGEKTFNKSEKNLMIEAAIHAINHHSESKKQRVRDVINQTVNNSPLRAKWNEFCKNHDLNFPAEDEEFLWKILRDKRNDYQHVKNVTISRQNIYRGAAMMEKALIAAVVKQQREVE